MRVETEIKDCTDCKYCKHESLTLDNPRYFCYEEHSRQSSETIKIQLATEMQITARILTDYATYEKSGFNHAIEFKVLKWCALREKAKFK